MVIPKHNYTLREKSVINLLSENVLVVEKIRTFLNVGFHGWKDDRAHWWIKFCNENGIDWKILEIFEQNIVNAISDGCPVDKIVLGDILNTETYETVDCLMFWHGPEHILKDEFLSKLPEIERKVNKLIIFGMPLGYEPQHTVYGNIHENHLSEWHSIDWRNLGYTVTEVHDRLIHQHLTAYKILNNE